LIARGINIYEDNEENLKLSLNLRNLAAKMQKDINDLITELKRHECEETEIEFGLKFYLTKFLNDNPSLKSSYIFRVECIKENNNIYYEIVIEEK